MDGLVRISRGCWLPEPATHDLATRCARLLQEVDVDTAVVGLTAARLHGLWVPAATASERIELAVHTPGRPASQMLRTRRQAVRPRRRIIPADHLTTIAGLSLTSIARTWRDLAKPEWKVEIVVTAAVA